MTIINNVWKEYHKNTNTLIPKENVIKALE